MVNVKALRVVLLHFEEEGKIQCSPTRGKVEEMLEAGPGEPEYTDCQIPKVIARLGQKSGMS